MSADIQHEIANRMFLRHLVVTVTRILNVPTMHVGTREREASWAAMIQQEIDRLEAMDRGGRIQRVNQTGLSLAELRKALEIQRERLSRLDGVDSRARMEFVGGMVSTSRRMRDEHAKGRACEAARISKSIQKKLDRVA